MADILTSMTVPRPLLIQPAAGRVVVANAPSSNRRAAAACTSPIEGSTVVSVSKCMLVSLGRSVLVMASIFSALQPPRLAFEAAGPGVLTDQLLRS
jgi:hypothetical protein